MQLVRPPFSTISSLMRSSQEFLPLGLRRGNIHYQKMSREDSQILVVQMSQGYLLQNVVMLNASSTWLAKVCHGKGSLKKIRVRFSKKKGLYLLGVFKKLCKLISGSAIFRTLSFSCQDLCFMKQVFLLKMWILAST
ncbi:uncharacterized protein LOC112092943 [Morus notabilis]|uniref:uncharacterized protein LOC112092943 n=1 Tax=Morus notabilis TaxID=981085 RepID=UPI000CED0C49|nr:uncharacterized protein LOC112092943 [Morus notabilis]